MLLGDCKSILVFPFKSVMAAHQSRSSENVAGEEDSPSGLPADELLAAAPAVTAKPSKLTHSGSEGTWEG